MDEICRHLTVQPCPLGYMLSFPWRMAAECFAVEGLNLDWEFGLLSNIFTCKDFYSNCTDVTAGYKHFSGVGMLQVSPQSGPDVCC